MRKILFVTGSQSWSGGVERACADLVNQIVQNQANEVLILSAMNGRNSFFYVDPDVRLDEVYPKQRSLQLYAVDFIYRLRTFFKQYRPDIIVVVESFLAAFIVPAALGLSIPIINWEHFGAHASLGVPVRRLARRIASRFCSHVVVLTESDFDLWLKKYRMDRRNISVIRNMNPMHRYTSETIEWTEKKVVLAVGRLEQVKGFDLLLEAWAKIVPSVRMGWRLRIVGDGAMRSQLDELALQLGISDDLELPGRTSEIASEYRKAGIFVLSSRHEGFVLVMMEAMTFGLPVVSFDCPTGPREVIEHGSNGVLVEHMNVVELAFELETLMSSPQRQRQLGNKSRLTVQNYSPDKVMNEWNRLFNEFC